MVTGVFHIGDKFIQPYLLCEVFVILSMFIDGIKSITTKDKYVFFLLGFFVWYGVVITILGPISFAGIEIVSKNLDDSFYKGYEKLKFSINNITQIGYLLLNMTTLICVFHHRENIDVKFLRKAFLISVTISVLIGYWEFIAKTTNIIIFPSELLMSGKENGLYIAKAYGRFRMSSLCTEASTFGAFISSAFWAIMAMRKRIFHYVLLILIFVSIVLSMSGTSYVVFLLGFFLYLFINGISYKYVFLSIFFFFLLYVILNLVGYYGDIFLIIAVR